MFVAISLNRRCMLIERFWFLCSSSSSQISPSLCNHIRPVLWPQVEPNSQSICRWILLETKNKYCFVRNFLFPIWFYRATNNNRCKFIRKRRLHLFRIDSKRKKIVCVCVCEDFRLMRPIFVQNTSWRRKHIRRRWSVQNQIRVQYWI